MDVNKNQIKKRLSEQLPTHSPDPGSWQRISAALDSLGADAAFQEKIEQLPQHAPDTETWSRINFRLNRIAYYKTATRIALAVAASLILFITVSRIADYSQKPASITRIDRQLHTDKMPDSDTKIQSVATEKFDKKLPENKIALVSLPYSAKSQASTKVGLVAKNEFVDKIANAEDSAPIKIIAFPENSYESFAEVPKVITDSSPLQEVLSADNQIEITTLQSEQISKQKTHQVKYYTPEEPHAVGKQNRFALAMNYLPENVNNGTDNSIFHNVDLTASYNKEKVRFNTSIGMAYNEEKLEFNMNYDIKTPVTAVGPGGHLDTLRYEVANVDSQYQGTEKHQYFTYNLGIGRRLFGFGKFSSWINAGAGFGIQVKNPDLIASTESSIKGQYNAQIISVNSDKPVYNDVNVNFVTGIDFNYAILNKFSITFAPTSRWYFKSLLTKDNQPTDELTLGFRTGLKLVF